MIKNKKIIAMITAMTIICMVAGTSIQARAAEKFDPVFYATLYEDVAVAFGTDAEALYNHYINFGQKEGRIPYAGAIGGETVDGINTIVNTANTNNIVQNPVCVANGHSWSTVSETIHHYGKIRVTRNEKNEDVVIPIQEAYDEVVTKTICTVCGVGSCDINGHQWTTTTETVHHPSKGRVVRTERKVIILQCGCGFYTESDDEFQAHRVAALKAWEGDIFRCPCGGNEVYTTHTEYTDKWVVTDEAYDEVVTKAVCAVCGMIQ